MRKGTRIETLFLNFLISDVEFLCLPVKFLTSLNISSTLQIKYNRALKKQRKVYLRYILVAGNVIWSCRFYDHNFSTGSEQELLLLTPIQGLTSHVMWEVSKMQITNASWISYHSITLNE